MVSTTYYTVQTYSTEFSQPCKVYADSEIYTREMDKKNARLARSRAFFRWSKRVYRSA